MKVPPNLTVLQGQKQTTIRRSPRVRTGDFQPKETSLLNSPADGRDVFEVVSLENRRAVATTPPQDMEEAEAALRQVKSDLGRMNRQDLRNLHRLEGLVHFYAT